MRLTPIKTQAEAGGHAAIARGAGIVFAGEPVCRDSQGHGKTG